MESFHGSIGCYKNGTDRSRDCRYFASAFLFAHIAISEEYMLTASSSSYVSAILLTCMTLVDLIATVHPYNRKNNTFNHLDPILMLFFVLIFA